ncbi:MAG: radical SAM protein [Tissierellia bacterium]|nr:radical SAM protein [Tissierellia bacterium]MDD4780884.1 radical SAM protein [Tissierellia bacterium]
MIAFLKKVRVKTIFSIFQPVKVEPLELCYLKSVLNNMNVENYLIDDLFNLKEPNNIIPDIIILTGYNVAENEIIKEARIYKFKFPKSKIIVGGVHIAGNAHSFHIKEIDYVFHSQSLNTFKLLIEKIINDSDTLFSHGVDTLIINKRLMNWHIGNKESIKKIENIEPDRQLFYQMSYKLRYLEKRNIALIKGSIGCPYNCSYCYCKILNNNHYVRADFNKILNEIEKINAEFFWIVDDNLFNQRQDALNFIEEIEKRNLKVKIIGYLRADFILKNSDLLRKLKNTGLVEVIVGFEAISNDELKKYDKGTNALDYPKVILLLKENNIDLTALFMVKPNYRFHDFRNLYKFIKENNIDIYTISILTPIKGTKDYELLKDNLLTHDPRKFDFMHLVEKSKLPKWIFYSLFYFLHINLLKSKRVRKYISNRRHYEFENMEFLGK